MRNRTIALTALTWSMLFLSLASTQEPYPVRAPSATEAGSPALRHELTPQAGPWLICVQVFKGESAKQLSQSMADYIIREHKVPAYVLEGNKKERIEEENRVAGLRKQYDDFVEQMRKDNPQVVPGGFKPRKMQIREEYAVLIGGPKKAFEDMESARKFLNEVRKFQQPPDMFCTQMNQARPAPGGQGAFVDKAFLNPFTTAFVGPNMTMPRPKREEEDPYPVLKNLNSEEPYSALKCSKPFTIVVRMYAGAPKVFDLESSGNASGNIFFGKKVGENLNASALQARALAEYLRKMKPNPYDAYVLHTQYYSLVTVGQYKTIDDPELKAAQRALGGMKLQAGERGGMVLDSLMPDPVVMKIPQPKK